VRRVGLLALVQRGLLPDALTPLVSRLIDQTSRTNGIARAPGDLLADVAVIEQARLTADLWDSTLIAIGVDPRFVREVADPETEVAVADVDADDKRFLFDWANGGTADLVAFRAEQARTLPAAPEGEDLRDAPEPAAGPGPGGTPAGLLQPGHGGVALGELGGRGADGARPEDAAAEAHAGESPPLPAGDFGPAPAPALP
jgi:hypothetical protein